MRTCGIRCKFILAIEGVTGGTEPQVLEAAEMNRGALVL